MAKTSTTETANEISNNAEETDKTEFQENPKPLKVDWYDLVKNAADSKKITDTYLL